MIHDDTLALQTLSLGAGNEARMFDLAPVSLWLEDLSAVKTLFAQWRDAGVTSLRDYLRGNAARRLACSSALRIVKVNRRTLELFEARDFDHLVAHLDQIFRIDLAQTHIEEFVQLWEGRHDFFSHTVSYTLSGRRLDIQLRGRILPGHEASWKRVLIAIEDVTERELALRKAASAEEYVRGLFDHSPVALWVEDYGRIKSLFDSLRAEGVADLAAYIDMNPDFIAHCIDSIRIVDINRRALELYRAADKATLMHNLGRVLAEPARASFRLELIELWSGLLFQQREVVNHALDGTRLHLYLQLSVFPGHETDWSLVQIGLVDITARKTAEAELEFLGQHDGLTKLHNRSFYGKTLYRLETEGPTPVTVVMVDLNGLKAANDRRGHAAGDELLRRTGDVLRACLTRSSSAARLGGDEFVVLMPGADERDGDAMMERIQREVMLNNLAHPGLTLSLSLGVATGLKGERMESLVNRADALMYESKRRFYANSRRDRRRALSSRPGHGFE